MVDYRGETKGESILLCFTQYHIVWIMEKIKQFEAWRKTYNMAESYIKYYMKFKDAIEGKEANIGIPKGLVRYTKGVWKF